MCYRISGMDGVVYKDDSPDGEKLLDKSIRDFLGMGKDGFKAKKPKNVTRKEEKA